MAALLLLSCSLADEAFKDLLKKHKQPVGLKASLKESVQAKGKRR